MLKKQIKQRFRGLYSIGRSGRDTAKNNKKLKASEALYTASHAQNVAVDYPIKTIVVDGGPKRLNLIFDKFDGNAIKDHDKASFLATGILFAEEEGYALRIISRNCLADAKAFVDFEKAKKIGPIQNYSFYSDSADRVSGKTYRLSVTKQDVFFTENDLEKLKDWVENGKH